MTKNFEDDGVELKVELDIEDFDGDDELYTLSFSLSGKNFKTCATYTEPWLCDKEKWIDFQKFLRNEIVPLNNMLYLGFYGGNGDSSISCDEKEIIFNAGPSGSGGDGEVTMSLNKDVFGSALANLLDPIFDNESLNKNWKI